MEEVIGTSLFGNRWELNDIEEYRDQIENATYHAWRNLIDFGKTYEYESIMKCAHHLIALFIEDYPSKYNAYDIGLSALKIAYIQLSQGKFEDPTITDLGDFPSKKIFDVELKMLSFPYYRCFSLMEDTIMVSRGHV